MDSVLKKIYNYMSSAYTGMNIRRMQLDDRERNVKYKQKRAKT